MIATKSSQLSLNLRDPRWRPVMNVNAAMAALDLDASEVDGLLEDGNLIGFNIAVDPHGRRELRVLTSSVEHYRATLGSRPIDLPFHKILLQLMPHSKPVLLGTEVDRALNCDRNLRFDLIRATELQATGTVDEDRVTNGIQWRRGNGGEARVTRASFEQFLKRRML